MKIIVLIILVALLPRGIIPSKIYIDWERLQLLKDSLDWMTFRRNGVLVPSSELKSLFLDHLVDKYNNDRDFRAFVIAFQKGVLPLLTLQENDKCNPSISKRYKDRFNKSITWWYQREFASFTYKDLYQSEGGNEQYCDYRKGLICNSIYNLCLCPGGTAMQPISPGSPVQRCLTIRDTICGVIDLDHGTDPSHSLLVDNIHQLIFNLEKPLGCQDGTQCRFKDDKKLVPRCYSHAQAPWYPGPGETPFEHDLGEPCALQLYATPGSCKQKDTSDPSSIGPYPGFVCYNLGPVPSKPSTRNRIGFCFDEYGPNYSIRNYDKPDVREFRPGFIASVHPRTIPTTMGEEIRDIYKTYLEKVAPHFDTGGALNVESEVGETCDVAKTQKMAALWKWFAELEGTPPPGENFVATVAEAVNKLQEVVDLAEDYGTKICRVYHLWSFQPNFALECVSGTCQYPLSIDPFDPREEVSKRLYLYHKMISEREAITGDYFSVSQIIEENPEFPCLPTLGSVPPTGRHHNPEALEGGYCPDGFVCYEDFSDQHIQYGMTSGICKVPPGTVQQILCHDLKEKLGPCEDKLLGKKVDKILEDLDMYAELDWGDVCDFDFEKAVRKERHLLGTFSKYLILNWIERGYLCDKEGKNLECKDTNKCECIKKTDCKKPGGGGGTKPGRPNRGGASPISGFGGEGILILVGIARRGVFNVEM